MTEPNEPDLPPETVEPDRSANPEAAVAPPPEKRRHAQFVMPALGLAGFVILAAAIAYLWLRPVPMPPMPAIPPDESAAVAALQSDVAALKSGLAALDAREKSDVAALHDAIAAIPPAPEATAQAQPAQPAPAASDTALQQRVAALSDRLTAIESAEAKQAQAAPSADEISDLSGRIDAVAQREARDGASLRQDLTLVQQQLATLSGQAQTFAKTATALPQLTARADRLSQILGAQAALRAGLPLGAIDNAPPALTRFATTAPPTEAALRVAFPEAAKAAEKAGGAQPVRGGFWHGMWLRVQDLVTVRQGERVVLGDATGAILAHAQRLLDAGDLSGALGVLGTLNGPAAAAMAPWEAQARALLDAQQALAKMAAG